MQITGNDTYIKVFFSFFLALTTTNIAMLFLLCGFIVVGLGALASFFPLSQEYFDDWMQSGVFIQSILNKRCQLPEVTSVFWLYLLSNVFLSRILVWSCYTEMSLSFPIQFDELRVVFMETHLGSAVMGCCSSVWILLLYE